MRFLANRMLMLGVWSVSAGVVWCQAPPPAMSPLDGTTPGINTPGSPEGVYHLSSIDTINHANGHLNIRIPLAQTFGRGDAATPLAINVESHWMVETVSYQYNCSASGCQTGTAYLPIDERWEVDEPTFAQGVMLTRTSGDMCAQLLPSNYWTNAITRLTFVGTDGTEHDFRDIYTGGQPEGQGAANGGIFDRQRVFQAYDGSDATFTATSDVQDGRLGCASGSGASISGTLTLKNGTAYTITNGYVTQIEDRNGNLVTFNNPEGVGGTMSPVQITDALNRQTLVCAPSTGSGPNNTQTQNIFYPDSNGLTMSCGSSGASGHEFTLEYDALSKWQTPQSSATLFPNIYSCPQNTSNCPVGPTAIDPNLLSKSTYPDQTTLTLSYDQYGNVTTVTLPTGGKYVYTYAQPNVIPTGSSVSCYWGSCPQGYVIQFLVTEKDIYTDNSTLVQKMFFCPLLDRYTGGYASAGKVVYTTPSGSYSCGSNSGTGILGIENHYTYAVNSLPPFMGTYYRGWWEGKEYQTDLLDTDGVTVLRSDVSTWQERDCSTETTCWFGAGNLATIGQITNPPFTDSPYVPEHDPRIIAKTTTLGAAPKSVTSEDIYTYSADQYNNEIEHDEYAFGSPGTGVAGSLYRKTVTTYEQYGSLTASPHILDLPTKVQTQDISGTTKAETDYCYDWQSCTCYPNGTSGQCSATQSLANDSGITAHDANYSTGYVQRGNATVINRTLTDSVHGLNQTLSTQYQYDIAGNIVSAIDPRGVRHDYGYSDGLGTYAFPTSITSYPVVGQTSPALTASATYNYNIGKPSSTTDVNGNTTTYIYADFFDRLTGINRPDQGWTTFSYVDSPGAFSVQSSTAQTSAGSIASTTQYDGLGRKTCNQLSTGSNSSIATTFSYDGKGRQSCASLPFAGSCSAGCSTSNGTVTTYDGMDRPTEVTEVGGANTVMAYGGAFAVDGVTPTYQTLVADSGNVWKRSAADRNGRVVEVLENPTGSAAWLGSGSVTIAGSNYTVGQSAFPTYTTTYSYDLLDDLFTVTQGAQSRSFTYDSLKRLVQATNPETGQIQYSYDASGNLSSKVDALRTVTWGAYDGLNRQTTKTYGDGTPTVAYGYGDGSNPVASGCFGLGKLTAVSTAATSTMPATANSYTCFDTMGRVTASSQTLGTGTPFNFGYTYDLSGALASTQYPTGRTVANTFDAAGRVCKVDSATGSSCTTNGQYAWNVSYAPQGAVSGLTLKNGLAETWSFNSRQQPTGLQASVGSTSLLNLTWGYGSNTATDNGNVLSQSITPGSYTTINQVYQYDAVNRLTLAVENPPNPSSPSCVNNSSGTWCENYTYNDQFGNRLETNYNLGGPAAPSSFDANNRNAPNTSCQQGDPLSGWRYDCVGNLTRDSSNATYAYDGENRQMANCPSQNNPASCSSSWASGNSVYTYDGEGRRVQVKRGDGSSTTYVYDATGELAVEYGSAVAVGTQYLTVDHLGSTRMVTSDAGVPTARMDYVPFGEVIPSSLGERSQVWDGGVQTYFTDQGVRPKFTGKERDSETGLDYFGARYFSSAQGRFTSPDKPFADQHIANPQSWNLYSYTLNNPLRWVDSDGEAVIEAVKKVTYDVKGGTAGEAWANAKAASGIPGGYRGNTDTNIGVGAFKFDYSTSVTKSDVTVTDTLTSADVNLTVTITLPNWTGYNAASDDDKKQWDQLSSGLAQHEDQHKSIAEDEAKKLDTGLSGTQGVGTAGTQAAAKKAADTLLGTNIQDKHAAVVTETQKRHDKLDADTDHGGKQ
jgi:RHS repeat-associated protein